MRQLLAATQRLELLICDSLSRLVDGNDWEVPFLRAPGYLICTYFCPPVDEFDGLVQGELNINPETNVDIDQVGFRHLRLTVEVAT